MPLAKLVVERSSVPDGLIDADQLNVVVADALRQLARLAVACDVLFAELMSDAEDVRDRVMSLSVRTSKLADRLDSLDALTVKVRTYIPTCSSVCSGATPENAGQLKMQTGKYCTDMQELENAGQSSMVNLCVNKCAKGNK